MLAALLLAALPEASLLDEWILKAERIALGRVERVLDLRSPASGSTRETGRIAVVRVERCLVGPERESVLHVVDTYPRSAPPVGALALFFVERWEDRHLPTAARKEIAEGVGGASVWQPLSNWSWLGGSPELVLPHWLAEERSSAGESLTVEPVLVSMEAALARQLPRIRAESGAHGGRTWRLSLGPDRAIVEGGASSGELSVERWNEILQLVDRADFFDLPEGVGQSSGPDRAVATIEVRTRRGAHTVRIEEGAPKSPEEVPAWNRARELWNALPGDHRSL